MNNNNFYKRKGSDGFSPYCKPCEITRNYNYYKLHPESHAISCRKNRTRPEVKEKERERKRGENHRQLQKQWRKENKDKLKGYQEQRKNKNHKISKKEWNACLKYFSHQCAYCGMTEKEHKNKYNQQLHKEHVIYNGSNFLDNCVPSCKSCNSLKNTIDLDVWYKEQPFFSEVRLNKINKWLSEDYKQYIEQNT
jgi:hypothetical protein